jgi:hypothetical protein
VVAWLLKGVPFSSARSLPREVLRGAVCAKGSCRVGTWAARTFGFDVAGAGSVVLRELAGRTNELVGSEAVLVWLVEAFAISEKEFLAEGETVLKCLHRLEHREALRWFVARLGIAEEDLGLSISRLLT